MPPQRTIPTSLTGRRFERLIVLGAVRTAPGRTGLVCRCDCGREKVVDRNNVLRGLTRSCGCLRTEQRPTFHLRHGKAKTPEWQAWVHLRDRCNNPNNSAYANYGGRGITVCPEWASSFNAFYRDMGQRPSPQHSLDRIDNNGPYAPWNCRWATRSQQVRNRRRSRYVDDAGSRCHVNDLVSPIGVATATVAWRIDHGWAVDVALNTPTRRGTRQA